jgi:hypothetical protein
MLMAWEAVAALCGLFVVGFAAGYLTRAYRSRRRRLSWRDD